tara:strand:- start:9095 stop:9253 length:159 start_codon:yes stop_codon:yes gene_type:complete
MTRDDSYLLVAIQAIVIILLASEYHGDPSLKAAAKILDDRLSSVHRSLNEEE